MFLFIFVFGHNFSNKTFFADNQCVLPDGKVFVPSTPAAVIGLVCLCARPSNLFLYTCFSGWLC